MFLAWAAIATTIMFAGYHLRMVFHPHYLLLERVLALGLFGAAVFFGINGMGYALWVIRSRKHSSARDHYFTCQSASSVACLIPIRDEPIDVVRETLASVCGLRFERKQVYLLDDSTDPENVRWGRSLAEAFGAVHVRRPKPEHFKAGNLNYMLDRIEATYIAVFDADQRPQATFLADLVPILDHDRQVALVQTPQAYGNTSSFIASAASLQNSLFYEYIAEAKDVAGAMFCCGTNCLIRTQALKQVGGFDVSTLTEDFATTLKLHAAGWKTRFYGSLYVLGLGPETLSAYLKQYYRWATGTLQVMVAALKLLIRQPRALSPIQWLEYALSCSYYLSGPVNFYLLLLPPAHLLLGVNPIRGNPFYYLFLFLIGVSSFWALFLFTAWQRGYSPREMVVACARLETCKFYVYTKALTNALFHRAPSFSVTDKGGGSQLPWRVLRVPLTVLALNSLAFLVGLARIGESFHWYLVINTMLAGYNAWMLSALLQHNTGSRSEPATEFAVYEAGPAHGGVAEVDAW